MPSSGLPEFSESASKSIVGTLGLHKESINRVQLKIVVIIG
jgi:hypothetical protein